MPTDTQIAVLCDIGQAASFDAEKTGQVERLMIDGYVARDGDLFKLTPKAEQFLAERGAGLNEF